MNKDKAKYEVGEWVLNYQSGLSGHIIERYRMSDGVWGYGIKLKNGAFSHAEEYDLYNREERQEIQKNRRG